MAENEEQIKYLDHLPIPSQFLNLLMGGFSLSIGGNIVRYNKREYSVTDSLGNKIFSQIPNAMSFWELCNFIGIENEDYK